MDAGTWGCGDELVAVLSATSGVLEELPVTVCRLGSGELEQVLAVVDRLAAVAAAARFTLASEADQVGRSGVRRRGRYASGWPTGARAWRPARWGCWRRR